MLQIGVRTYKRAAYSAKIFSRAGIAQLVERMICNLEATSSTLVSGSRISFHLVGQRPALHYQLYSSNGRDVFRWVTIEGDQIG
jgi:hypothetical protein